MTNNTSSDNNQELAEIIPIDREQRSFESSLAVYESKPDLRNFLNVFEMAFHNPKAMSQAAECLQRHGISHWKPLDIEHFQNLVARLNFQNMPLLKKCAGQSADMEKATALADFVPESEPLPFSTSDTSGEEIEKLEAMIDDLGKEFEQAAELMKGLLDESNRYYIFVPALEIEESLRKDFADADDPGKKLADYARAAFSRPSKSSVNREIASIDVDGTTAICLLTLIQDIPKARPAQYPSSSKIYSGGLSKGMEYALKYLMRIPSPIEQDTSDDEADDDMKMLDVDYWFLQTLAHSFELTQNLFDCLLEHQFKTTTHHAYSPMVFHTLCQFPLEAPYATHEEFDFGTDKIHLGYQLSEESWNGRWHRLPYVRWSQAHKLTGEYFSSLSGADAIAALGYKLLMKKYVSYRKKNGGYSPLNIDQTSRLWGCVRSYVDDTEIDLDPMLMIGGLYPIILSCDGELGCSWLFNEDGTISSSNMAKRSSVYLAISGQAYEDGMSEFGASILGFFLYSQSLFADDGLHTNISKITPLINYGLEGPGRQILEKCLEVAVARLGVENAPLEAMILSAFLRPRPTLLSINSSVEKVMPLSPDHAITRRSLLTKYPLVFERFCKDAQERLIDAELMWLRMASEFGNGIGDWGPLGVALTKPLEVELVRRLEIVYLSEEYKQFHREQFLKEITPKVTLGGIVHMLKANNSLPETIKSNISAAGFNLPIELKLLRTLEKVLSYRNQASHSDPFTEEDYRKLRVALFNENGLTGFAEALAKVGFAKA